MGPLIEARRVCYSYPDGTPALRGVDLDLYRQECLIILGPNGSGKTSFLLRVAGLLDGEGDITVCGLPGTRGNLPTIRRRIGLVFQDADEQLFMPTVLEDVMYGLMNQGKPLAEARDAALEALNRVGMGHAKDKPPYHLSGGEKRRVALAGVLAMEPDILIFDEPTTSLDPPGQRELMVLLAGLPQAKIITTHDCRFARALGTRAVFFDRGLIAAQGSVDELIERFHWEAVPDLTPASCPK